MKKLFLSFTAICALSLVACNDSDAKKTNEQANTQTSVQESVKENVKESVKESVKAKVEESSSKLSNAVENASKSLGEAGEKISEQVSKVVDSSADKIDEVIDATVDKASEVIENSAKAVANKVAEITSVDGEKLFKKCVACHGKKAEKLAPGAEVVVNTLSEQEIYDALSGYKAGTFGGKSKKTMELQVKKLNDEDFKALAKYIKTL